MGLQVPKSEAATAAVEFAARGRTNADVDAAAATSAMRMVEACIFGRVCF